MYVIPSEIAPVGLQDMGGVKQEQGEGTQPKGPNASDPVNDEVIMGTPHFRNQSLVVMNVLMSMHSIHCFCLFILYSFFSSRG